MRGRMGLQAADDVPGVGALTALTFKTAIDDPTRIAKSRDVGPLFGLTPGRYGRTPCRHRTNRSGSRRAMRPSQCIAARSRRRNRGYFRCAHFPRASLK